MKIGILQADSVREQFRKEFGDYPAMFATLLNRVSEQPLTLVTYSANDLEFPEHPEECDGYLITGSRYSAYEQLPWIAGLSDCVQKIVAANKKLVGICFGHQLIAQVYGGKIGQAAQGWGVGVGSAQLTPDNSENSLALLYSHQDQVFKPPLGAQVFASSDFCPVAGFSLGDNVLTFQGHPEFTRAYARKLMDLRRELLGEAVYLAGIKSLEKGTDEVMVAKWILDFFSPNWLKEDGSKEDLLKDV